MIGIGGLGFARRPHQEEILEGLGAGLVFFADLCCIQGLGFRVHAVSGA